MRVDIATACVAALMLASVGAAEAADLSTGLGPASVIDAPTVGAPVAIMASPIRSRFFRPIQTHIIAQPAPNPRAVGEGPVFGPAAPVIIVVKPSGR